MSSSELSVLLTARGNLQSELAGARDKVKDLSKQIRDVNAAGGSVGDDLADEFRTATQAAGKLSDKLSQVNRDVKRTASESTSAAAKISKAWQKTASVFNNDLVAGLSAASLLFFGKKAVNTFAQVQDASSALSATFGANGDALIKWSKASGDALNLSQQEALSATQTFAGFASSAGLTGTALEEFSTSLTARAADLASYYGGSTADAITAIGAALRGESEPARRYQIFVDDMALKNEYFALTGEKVTGALTMQQKIMAANTLIMKQSSRAQGDIARTGDSMANQMKDSEQQMADFQATAGDTIAIGLNPMLKLVNGLARGFSQLPDPVKKIATAIGLVAAAALIATPRIMSMAANMKIAGITATTMGTKVKAAGSFLMGPWGAALAVGGIALGVFADQAAKAEANVDTFKQSIDSASGALTQSGLATITKDLLTSISSEDWNTFQQFGINVQDVTAAIAAGGKEWQDYEGKLNRIVMGKQSGSAQVQILADNARNLADQVGQGKEAWRIAGDAAKIAGAKIDEAGNFISDAGDAAEETADKINPLTRAMNRFGHALDVRSALQEWKKSLADNVKKPSAETAVAAADSFMSMVGTYKEGGRAQAKFVADNYAAMKSTIDSSGLDAATKANLIGPLEDAKAAADKVLTSLDAIATMKVMPTIIVNKLGTPGMAPSRFATGGLVTGAGSATSDSIPALLSNGEYVIRAAAARRLGVGTLNSLNRAGKMADPALAARLADRESLRAPLVGSMEINVNNPSKEIDVEKAVMRGMARAARIQSERGSNG